MGEGQDQNEVWGGEIENEKLIEFDGRKSEFHRKTVQCVVTTILSLFFPPSVYSVEFCSKKLIWAVQKSSQLLFSDHIFGSGKWIILRLSIAVEIKLEIAICVVNSATDFLFYEFNFSAYIICKCYIVLT